jgi:hypothetical protein
VIFDAVRRGVGRARGGWRRPDPIATGPPDQTHRRTLKAGNTCEKERNDMRHPLRILVVLLAYAVMCGATIAAAQDGLTFDTSFAFRLGTQVHQPGNYVVRVTNSEMELTVTSAKGAANQAAVVTRLAEPDSQMSEGRVVFDKVGDVYYLSEVWIPGSDGYLLHVTKEKHTHVKVKAIKKG